MTSGTSTGLPLLTTSAIAEPACREVPVSGSVLITEPRGTSSLTSRVTMPAASPASFSSAFAFPSATPARSGTFTVFGPSDTVSVTASLSRIRSPTPGSVLMTLPRFTVSL